MVVRIVTGQKEVQGNAESAGNPEKVAGTYPQFTACAEQIQPGRSNEPSPPDPDRDGLFENYRPDYRYRHDIQSGQKTGIRGSGIEQCSCLESIATEKSQPKNHACPHRRPGRFTMKEHAGDDHQ